MEERIGENALLRRGESGQLLVAFGSIMSALNRNFEFHGVLSKRGDNVLFLRDEKPICYHSGFTGLTGSIEENVEFLRYLKKRLGAERMTCLGISSGGYSAILHGYLAGADDVLTVNPRTYVSYETGRRLGCGPRLPRQFDPIYEHYARLCEEPRHLDLRQVFSEHRGRGGPIIVHYADNLPMDVINVGNIDDCPLVETIRHVAPSHEALAPMLRNRGVIDGHLDNPPERLVAYHRGTGRAGPQVPARNSAENAADRHAGHMPPA